MLWCSSSWCDFFDVFATLESFVYSTALFILQPILQYFEKQENVCSASSWWIWGDFFIGNASLLLLCAILTIALKGFHLLLKNRWKAYSKLPTENRQLYVLANLCKATCLAILFFSKIWIIDVYDAFVFDQWDTMGERRLMRVKNISALYVATDVIALFIVPKLPSTTVIHHYVSWLLAMIIFGTDVRMPQSTVVRMILLYGAWSTVPYSVNAFLALRRLFEDVDDSGNLVKQEDKGEKVEEKRPKLFWLESLAIFALVLYAITCACNWMWHLHWLIGHIAFGVNNWYVGYNASIYTYFFETTLTEWFPTILIVLYSLSSLMLARDDVILMQWLWERALSNGFVRFIAETASMTKLIVWSTCKAIYSRPLKHVVKEKVE